MLDFEHAFFFNFSSCFRLDVAGKHRRGLELLRCSGGFTGLGQADNIFQPIDFQ